MPRSLFAAGRNVFSPSPFTPPCTNRLRLLPLVFSRNSHVLTLFFFVCASLGVHNFCTTGSPICPLLDMSYVPCIRTDNTQFKGRAREHNSWCLMYVCVCVVLPSIVNASSLHLSVYSVWAHQPGSHRRKANTVVFFFWGGETTH